MVQRIGMNAHQQLDKKKAREASIGLVVILSLAAVLCFLTYRRLANKHLTPTVDALQGRTIYYKDSPDGLVATNAPVKSSLLELPDIESNQMVDLGNLKKTSPESFFKQNPLTPPSTGPSTGPLTRLASAGSLPPGKGSGKTPTPKTDKNQANDPVGSQKAIEAIPDRQQSSTAGPTTLIPQPKTDPLKTDSPQKDSLPEAKFPAFPATTLPKKQSPSKSTPDNIRKQNSTQKKEQPTLPTSVGKPETLNPLPSASTAALASAAGGQNANSIFSAAPSPVSGHQAKALKGAATQTVPSKVQTGGRTEVREVNHYVELSKGFQAPAPAPAIKRDSLPLSLYHKANKNAIVDSRGNRYVRMLPKETLREFSLRTTGVPGFERAVFELNRSKASAGGRFAEGSILRVMRADQFMRFYPKQSPTVTIYYTAEKEQFFSIAHDHLHQAGRYTLLIQHNNHLKNLFGVPQLSGTEEFPPGTPIILPQIDN